MLPILENITFIRYLASLITSYNIALSHYSYYLQREVEHILLYRDHLVWTKTTGKRQETGLKGSAISSSLLTSILLHTILFLYLYCLSMIHGL